MTKPNLFLQPIDRKQYLIDRAVNQNPIKDSENPSGRSFVVKHAHHIFHIWNKSKQNIQIVKVKNKQPNEEYVKSVKTEKWKSI